MKKHFIQTVAVILTVCLLAQPSLIRAVLDGGLSSVKVYAAETSASKAKDFVSDLRLYQSSSPSKAKEKAKADGYTLFESNGNPVDLNEDTGEDYIFVGYKTTTDEAQAYRDIKMLEMDRGYEWYDYLKVVEGQTEKIEPQAADVIIAATEMKEKLKAGSRMAKYAKDFLNLMYFTEKVEQFLKQPAEKRIALGDWLLSDKISADTIKKIIVQANGGSLTAMYSQLAIGVSDNGQTWAERIPESDVYKDLLAGNMDYATAQTYDKMYYGYANELLPKVREFVKACRNAQQRQNSNNGAIKMADIADKEEPDAETAQEVTDASADEASGDILNLAAYGVLNKYNIKNKGVGDYILSLGEANYETREDMRRLYPLVEALTDGQYAMAKVVGIAQLAMALNQSDDVFKEMDKQKADVIASIKDATGGESTACVWAGVNTEFYERKVALTSKAYRESNASRVYEDLMRQGDFYEKMNFAFMGIGLAGSAAMLISSCIWLGLLIAGSQLSVWAACASIVGTGVLATIGGVIGCASVIVSWAALAAIVVLAIVYFIHWLIHLDDDDDDEPYTKMPDEIYDWRENVTVGDKKQNVFVKYDVLRNSGGSAQDINANEGKRWNLLYATKDERIGSPVCLNELGQAFARTVNKLDPPEGFEPVTCFGAKDAANLNSYVDADAKALYLHFVTKDKLDGTIYREDGEIKEADVSINEKLNQGTKQKLEKGEQYLNGLMVVKESSESAAKTNIQKNPGFKVYDKNLTPGNGYTYIGYSSTSVPENAITDIRVVPNFNGDSIGFGSATYGNAGILPDNSALVYTRFASAGVPIIDTFVTSETPLGKESPYEPVNMFGGGEYDLNRNHIFHEVKDWTISGTRTPMYLYFKPSVSFTSGEEYIGGIQFISEYKSANTSGKRTAAKLAEDLGLTFCDVDLGRGTTYESSHVVRYYTTFQKHGPSIKYNYTGRTCYLCYSSTYNPYRAIYDASVYMATPRLSKLPASISGVKGYYAAAENTMLTNKAMHMGTWVNLSDPGDKLSKDEYEKTKAFAASEDVFITSSRAYSDKILDCDPLVQLEFKCTQKPDEYGRTHYFTMSPKYESNLTYEYSKWRLQGMYQLGPVEGMTPLKVGDLVVSKSSKIPEGMHSIQRFTDPHKETATHIGMYSANNSSYFSYVYLRGAVEPRGKYISGLDVVTYKPPQNTERKKYSSDELKAYAQTSDDQCIIGLAGKVDGQIYNYNIAIDQNKAWYNNPDTTATQATYVGVTRTDDPNCAITGVLMYRVTDNNTPPVRIKVGGVEYRRTGDKAGDYYFYYTKNPGANPGVPVEDLNFSDTALVKGESTVIGVTGADSNGNAKYADDFKGLNGYFHLTCPSENVIITDGMRLFEGERSATNADAQAKLKTEVGFTAMSQGYHNMITESLNYGTSQKPIYLFYNMCSEKILDCDEDTFAEAHEDYEANWNGEEDDFDFDEEFWDDFDFDFDVDIAEEISVRDIIGVRSDGAYPGDTYKYDGRTYKAVEGKLPVNKNSYGESIWLYYTTERVGDLSPIHDLCICSGDSVPYREDAKDVYGKWETLLDTRLEEVNLNEGILESIGTTAYFKDCRLYMFINRYRSDVKQKAKINRGLMSDTVAEGDLFWSNAS